MKNDSNEWIANEKCCKIKLPFLSTRDSSIIHQLNILCRPICKFHTLFSEIRNFFANHSLRKSSDMKNQIRNSFINLSVVAICLWDKQITTIREFRDVDNLLISCIKFKQLILIECCKWKYKGKLKKEQQVSKIN